MASDDLEARKTTLEDQIDSLGSWMLGFTWPVAVGLFIEFYAIFNLVWTRDWNSFIDRIGLLLVTGGVSGELLIEHKTHRAERRLRGINVEIERESDLALKAADERMLALDARIAEAKQNLALAEQHSSEANAKAESFRLEIAKAGESSAQANARAAEAQRMAEAERLERIRLEAIVAPRSISIIDQRAIAASLLRFAGSRVNLASYSLDGEGAVLGQQVIAILQAARIEVDNRIATMMPMGGFAFGIHVNGTRDDLVMTLRDALSRIGHLAVAPENTPISGGGGPIMQAGPVSRIPVNAAILIGIKPVPVITAR